MPFLFYFFWTPLSLPNMRSIGISKGARVRVHLPPCARSISFSSSRRAAQKVKSDRPSFEAFSPDSPFFPSGWPRGRGSLPRPALGRDALLLRRPKPGRGFPRPGRNAGARVSGHATGAVYIHRPAPLLGALPAAPRAAQGTTKGRGGEGKGIGRGGEIEPGPRVYGRRRSVHHREYVASCAEHGACRLVGARNIFCATH